MSLWEITYEVWVKDGELYISKNHFDDVGSFLNFYDNKSLLYVASNIAYDLMLDIYGYKYHPTSLSLIKDITKYDKLIKERNTIYGELFEKMKYEILIAYLHRVESEDEPIIELNIDVNKVKEILNEKLNLKS